MTINTTARKLSAPIRVLVIDDSLVIREVLRDVLDSEHDMEVIGTASDPLLARTLIKTLDPDVLTLDIEMAGMNGLEFLEHLMRLRPMPVVMISSHTHPGDEMSIRALEMGAVDVVGKNDGATGLFGLAAEITSKVRAAANARIRITRPTSGGHQLCRRDESRPAATLAEPSQVVGIGASTGGVQALNVLLGSLPEDSPPILIVQHMPAGFTPSFARRLDRNCRLAVTVAEHGMPIVAGRAYLAPGDRHLVVAGRGARLSCGLVTGPPVNQHIPSIDVLFSSMAEVVRRRGVGVILTGMGKDGSRGLERMRAAGASTACQNEATSVVYGMPKAAVEIGATEQELPLDRIAAFIMRRTRGALPRRQTVPGSRRQGTIT